MPTRAPDQIVTADRATTSPPPSRVATRAIWAPPATGAMAHGATTGATSIAGQHERRPERPERPERPVAVIASTAGRVVLGPDDGATFGRGRDVHLRIGHAPVEDDLIADVAGAFFVRDGRVLVANSSPQLAFDVAVPGRPLLPLSPGDWHSPVDPAFTVVVEGTLRYRLDVTSPLGGGGFGALFRGEPAPGTGFGPPHAPGRGATPRRTVGGAPQLSARQRAILDAYVAPMADGLPPATHQQVAESIGCCRQTVRLECAKIEAAFYAAGVPMRDWRDARDAVTDAWARHRF